jgi:hypothetical protein
MECYYEPLSKCTIDDALKSYAGQPVTLRSLPQIGEMGRAAEEKILSQHTGDANTPLFPPFSHNLFSVQIHCTLESILSPYNLIYSMVMSINQTCPL